MLCIARNWASLVNGIDWHVGEKIRVADGTIIHRSPTGRATLLMLEQVGFIQADGHELEWIKENFVNLPYPKDARVVSWTGDLARMIAFHIPRTY
jgi:hypothetical protein